MEADKSKRVAELLGWKIIHNGTAVKRIDGTIFPIQTWHPTTNLAQAVDHIVPVLEKLGFHISFIVNGDQCFISNTYTGENYSEIGTGNTPSERMADALCSVFISVMEEK